MKLAVMMVAAVLSNGMAVAEPADVAPNVLTQYLQSQHISGTLRMNYYQSSKNRDDNADFFGATAQFKALPDLTETINGKVEARVTNPSPGDGGHTESELLEGYVTAHFETSDLRIGKQIIAWGRADGINPTDNLTPRNFMVMLPFEDDQRFGTTALKFDGYLSSERTLSIFMTPFFEPSKIPFPADASLKRQAIARSLSNSELGLKFDQRGEGFDASLSYFHGFSLLPDMRVTGVDVLGPILELHYDKINVFGADFARNFGRFGFRGELVYVDTIDDAGQDPGIKNPYLFWILGIDRTFFENLNVNLQFFQRQVRRFHNAKDITDYVARSIAIQNAIVDGQQDRISHGISFRVSNKWFNDTLEAEIFVVVNTTRHDSFTRPLLTYAFSDHWKGTVGAELYHGVSGTQFGNLKENRGALAELRYSF